MILLHGLLLLCHSQHVTGVVLCMTRADAADAVGQVVCHIARERRSIVIRIVVVMTHDCCMMTDMMIHGRRRRRRGRWRTMRILGILVHRRLTNNNKKEDRDRGGKSC
jgi:hypothetical protein